MLLLRLWRSKIMIYQHLLDKIYACRTVSMYVSRLDMVLLFRGYDIELFTDRVLPVNFQFSKIKVFIADDKCTFLKHKTETIKHVF